MFSSLVTDGMRWCEMVALIVVFFWPASTYGMLARSKEPRLTSTDPDITLLSEQTINAFYQLNEAGLLWGPQDMYIFSI